MSGRVAGQHGHRIASGHRPKSPAVVEPFGGEVGHRREHAMHVGLLDFALLQSRGRLEKRVGRNGVRLPTVEVELPCTPANREGGRGGRPAVVGEAEPDFARIFRLVLGHDADGAAAGRGFVLVDGNPLLEHLGGQHDAAADAGRHPQPHQVPRLDIASASLLATGFFVPANTVFPPANIQG